MKKPKALPETGQHLKPAITVGQLDEIATAIGDNEAVRHLNQTRANLFNSISKACLAGWLQPPR